MNSRCFYLSKIILIPLFLISFLSTLSFADDAPIRLAGGVAYLIDAEDSDISMESEVVKIELGLKSYTVDAVFEFFNHGKTKTLMVGFPNCGAGLISYFKDTEGVGVLKDFETWVNGEKCEFEFTPGEIRTNSRDLHKLKGDEKSTINNPDEINKFKTELKKGIIPKAVGWLEERHWFVKKVPFEENNKTKTKVRYEAANTGPHGGVEYILGTGRSWKGNIGRAIFIVKASPEVWVSLSPRFCLGGRFSNIRDYDINRIDDYTFQLILTNIEPEENEVLRIFVSSRLLPWESEGEFVYENSPVPDEILEILSTWHLRILRNTYFALHGRKFKSPELDKYFRSKHWYIPRPDYNDSYLSDIQLENVKKIYAYENKIKKAKTK